MVPIGEDLVRKGLEKEIRADFYTSCTRPPTVYRGNPFLIEVALAYGGSSQAVKVSLEALTEMLEQAWREVDLRHHDQHLATCGQRMCGRAQVNLGLAAGPHAMQQKR